MFLSKYFKLLLFISIELIVLYSVNYYGINLDINLKYLYVFVLTLSNILFFYDLFSGLINFTKNNQEEVSSYGIKWTFSVFYSIASFGILLILTFNNISTETNYIIQSILFVILLFGLYSGKFSGNFANNISIVEDSLLANKNLLQQLLFDAQALLNNKPTVSNNIKNLILEIKENARFITPSLNESAKSLDLLIIEDARKVNDLLSNTEIDNTEILAVIEKMKNNLQSRRQIITN